MTEGELLYSINDDGRPVKVWQQGKRRWLEYGDELIQTEIDVTRPDILPESFNRAMLSGALFNGKVPKNVLLAGTGGGSTARYFANRFPDVTGDAVDLSSQILDIACRFFDCPNQGNWQLIEADIRDHVQHCQSRYDLIVLDIAIGQASPDWMTAPDFLSACRCLLTKSGHLAINLIVENDQGLLTRLAAIRQAFDRRTVCVTLPKHRNIIILAFNQLNNAAPNHAEFKQLEAQWQVEFGQFYQQMLKDNPKGSGII